MEMDSLPKQARMLTLETPQALFVVIGIAYIAALITTFTQTDIATRLGIIFSMGLSWAVIFLSIVFIVSQRLHRTDIVDAAWGPTFIVATVASFIAGAQTIGLNVQTLILLLVTIWGVRLSYVITRRLLTHPEDKRYVELRKHWRGSIALNTYGRIFFVQAVLASLVSLSAIYANASPATEIGIYAALGAVMWLIGFVFEAVADWQLKQFLKNKANRGTLMTSGLWRYTRHPNYFGEATQWLGIFLISCSCMYAWVGLLSPLLITYLLLCVSGVPITEKAFAGRKGWDEYKARTSKFLPLPPRKV